MVQQLKAIGLVALVLALIGCRGDAPKPEDHVDAPEVKTPISQDKAMKDRGMSAEEQAREKAAIGASTPSGAPR